MTCLRDDCINKLYAFQATTKLKINTSILNINGKIKKRFPFFNSKIKIKQRQNQKKILMAK